ncbi:ABC transporter ATP-binding protein [Rhizobium sullae]|uniref:ATP-binding cassette subfamily B multidrug efflux pump n=1 Tax=Rhizobium sullae TaxID=50338 RepID=A0A4R3Q8L2_RHISU|nr:ABC transporter ATP-binding protein [Rhizobium sullae]TCU16994.1 ATP-binding cassette subfamily B multidrug efflux pump [Rhizobium sullae]
MLERLFTYFERLIKIEGHELSLPKDASSMQILLQFLRPFKWLIIASSVTGMLLTASELARLWAVSWLVDAVAYSQNLALSSEKLFVLGGLILAYLLLDPIIWLINYMLRMQSLRSQTRASTLWQSHKAAAQHDLSYFNAVHAGQVAGRINQVSLAVQGGAELLAGRFPLGLIRFLGSACLVAYLAPLFVIPVVLWIILNGVFAIWLAPKVNQQAARIAETSSSVNGAVTEYFSNIRSIKTYFAYDLENAYVYGKIDDQNDNNLAINRLTTTTGLCIRILNTGLVAAILALGVYGLSQNQLSPGEFVAGVTLAIGMATDAGWFVSIWEGLTQALGAIKDARTTIDPRPTITTRNPTAEQYSGPPDIELMNATFAYPGGPSIIKGASLGIRSGTKVAIVGPSGSGKSTLVDLLLRHYDVSAGAIKFNGEDIREIPLDKLRAAFAVVSQGDSLFHRSIRENIAFGREGTSLDDIIVAARKAHADTFIEQLVPDNPRAGYDLLVGDRGTKLSGGQQQRILLARAFLQRRPVLILDEATSALDSQSEAIIQRAIDEHSESTTIIAIAHRLSTIRNFDMIAVMNAGEIVAVGSHDELLSSNTLYRSLWQKQMAHVNFRPADKAV